MDELKLEYAIDWKASELPTDQETKSLIGYVNGSRAFHIPVYGNKYHAYFMPNGWVNFGQAVRFDPCERFISYATVEEAKDDCSKHLTAFGLKANSNSKLGK